MVYLAERVMALHLLSIGALLWAGMIIGISFLESWVKFKTPTLSKLVGLEVGRTVFHSFHQVQIALLFFLIVVYVLHAPSLLNSMFFGILISVVLLQVFWVFPILCQRVDELAKGKKPPYSFAHTVYGIGELVKFFVLLALGIQGCEIVLT
ncbi:MAG TPA: hypothetical protein PK657_12835 [Legionella sp.]|nr:hypothetical protein [Legionella sp.]